MDLQKLVDSTYVINLRPIARDKIRVVYVDVCICVDVVDFPFHWWCACTKLSRLELDNDF